MSEKRIEKAWQSMVNNLQAKTGKPLEEWIEIINKQPFTRTSDKVSYLKKEYGQGQGYAGLIIYHAKIALSGAPDTPEQLIEKQYLGKENLKPIYDKLVDIVSKFGEDVEIAPRNSYVSITRNTQFAMFTPATKIRFDVALKLKGQEPKGVLEALPSPGLCTHKIKVNSLEDITPEVIDWLKLAYDKAK
jgi:predicted transport protein